MPAYTMGQYLNARDNLGTERVELLRTGAGTYNTSGALHQDMRAAMSSWIPNLWPPQARYPVAYRFDGTSRSLGGCTYRDCSTPYCQTRRQAIINFVNSLTVTNRTALAAGGLITDTSGDTRMTYIYPLPPTDTFALGRIYNWKIPSAPMHTINVPQVGQFTADPAPPEPDRPPIPEGACNRGYRCAWFTWAWVRERRRRIAGGQFFQTNNLCAACGRCDSCSMQCTYSTGWAREGLSRQCCSCLISNHSHCGSCGDAWFSPAESAPERCGDCSSGSGVERAPRDYGDHDYAYAEQDVSHLIYNCASCSATIGNCTCVPAYL